MLKLEPLLQSNQGSEAYGYILYAAIPQWDKYKEDITQFSINTFLKDYNPKFGYNVMLSPENNQSISPLYKEFIDICVQNFDNLVIDKRNREIAWAYVQNKERYNSIWHNHKRSTTINAVWYPRIPDPTGTISVREGMAETELPIKEGYIYFWPHWLDHKPNPQKYSNDWRVSINLELLTTSRPIVKNTNCMW